MKKTISIFILFFISPIAFAVGLHPIPQISDVDWRGSATYDSSNGEYNYSYSISSGSGNNGNLIGALLDIKSLGPPDISFIPQDFSLSGGASNIPFIEAYNDFLDYKSNLFGKSIEAVSTNLPQGWESSLRHSGYLRLSASVQLLQNDGTVSPALMIEPGDSYENINVNALSPPTLREVILEPKWTYIPTSDEAYETEKYIAAEFSDNLNIHLITIGPENTFNSVHFTHFRLLDDIEKMRQMGWLQDLVFIDNVVDLLSQSNSFNLDNKGTEAKAIYLQIKNLMLTVDEFQMNREAIDLIRINAQHLYENQPETSIPKDPIMLVSPVFSEYEIGNQAIFSIQLVDRARNNEMIQNLLSNFELEVLSGPHAGLINRPIGFGNGTISYIGSKEGTDIVEIRRIAFDDGLPEMKMQVEVKWEGGPDYVISFFSPPYLDYDGAQNIFISDSTKNIGTIESLVNTVTRYYLSATPEIDPNTAFVLYERSVLPLSIATESSSNDIQINWPSQFPEGTYYFAACTDANNNVVELNENNNCSFHKVDQVAYTVAVLNSGIINAPPNCDNAVASPDSLWPPNHKFKNIDIQGVTDIDQDVVTIVINSIMQDEEVNDISSGSTSPDGKGIGTSIAQIRSERNGTGDGRVYEIGFTATDTAGNECTGSVRTTSIVHDQSGSSSPAIDSGLIYDSTMEY